MKKWRHGIQIIILKNVATKKSQKNRKVGGRRHTMEDFF